MSGTRRLQKEFKDLQSSGIIETESVKNLEIDSQSILQWSGNLNPTKVTVDLRFFFVKWGASFRWSFHPNSAWGSMETTTIGQTHPTLTHLSFWELGFLLSRMTVFRKE